MTAADNLSEARQADAGSEASQAKSGDMRAQKPSSAETLAAPISVVVNGKSIATAAQTLAQLVAERNLGDAKIATALNGDFVPAGRRSETGLHAGDAIEIVAPRQGG